MKKIASRIDIESLLVCILLAVFYLLHEWNARFVLMGSGDFGSLLITYVPVAAGIYILFAGLVPNKAKACLLSVLTIFFFLFFGALQDAVGMANPVLAYAKYFFPAALFLYILAVILILKWKRRLLSPRVLLSLLLVYLCIEGYGLYENVHFNKKPLSIKVHGAAKKPDIYLLLYDEYASSTALLKYWHYNNQPFDSFLLAHNFRIMEGARSNYNATALSVPSVFLMDYLPIRYKGTVEEVKNAYTYTPKYIYNSPVPAFLQQQGYDIYNYSFFNLKDHPFLVRLGMAPFGFHPIYEQTFLGRLEFALRAFTGKKPWEREELFFTHNNNTEKEDAVKKVAITQSARPKFVFMHVLSPHRPYYTDSTGRLRKREIIYSDASPEGYTAYLSYCNKNIRDLVTTIDNNSQGNAIIILMGDHGFRDPKMHSPGNEHLFMNMLAIRMNDSTGATLQQVNSLVNLFPAVFNSVFHTRIPLKKDSSIHFLSPKAFPGL